MIDATVVGGDDLITRLEAMPAAVASRLGNVIGLLAQSLYEKVEENLSGAVLQSRTGALGRAINLTVDGLSASVGFDADAAPYGAAQEFGATIPAHLIAVKNAKALAFLVGGERVFAKRVMFPGVRLPERSFLRSALSDMTPDIQNQIAAGVAEAVT
jgi:hypothetical protein